MLFFVAGLRGTTTNRVSGVQSKLPSTLELCNDHRKLASHIILSFGIIAWRPTQRGIVIKIHLSVMTASEIILEKKKC